MIKNVIALVSLTALTGLAVSVAAVGCSSSTETTTSDGGTDDGDGSTNKPRPDSGTGDTDGGGEDEVQGHSGLPCTGVADCQADGDDDQCSKGGYKNGDLHPTPVCVDINNCTLGNAGTIEDVLCDEQTGVCLQIDAATGVCLPACIFNEDGFEEGATCAGKNKCNAAYILTAQDGTHSSLGFCFGGCTADADCEGTAGQKCQVEDALCVNPDAYVTYKAVGEACTDDGDATTPAECNCGTVLDDKSPDADSGFCTSACVTGAAGDAYCGTAKAGWTCTAKLSAKDDKGAALFGKQPDGILGQCALPCTADTDCTGAGLTAGATAMTCQEFAGGKFCSFPVPAN